MDPASPNSISVFDLLRQRMGMPAIENFSMPSEEANRRRDRMIDGLRKHWPEYLMEATELGLFMISACAFTVLLYHPISPLFQDIHNELLRRVLLGIAMGSTAVAIILSPFGKRSGAHFNPAVTLTFFRLRKIEPWDAAFYTLFQFIGGIVSVLIATVVFGGLIAHQAVNYAATLPAPGGPLVAFFAEVFISFILMSVVLTVSNTTRLSRWTGPFAGLLVATYITIESPISGVSMNPARSFGSVSVAQLWNSLWIYFTAPPLGMLLAAEIYSRLKTGHAVACVRSFTTITKSVASFGATLYFSVKRWYMHPKTLVTPTRTDSWSK